MTQGQPIKVLYYENNADGTIGGSYFSLLFLAKGLDRRRFIPTVVFRREHNLLPAFEAAGIDTVIWPKAQPFDFSRKRLGPFKPVAMAFQQAANFVRMFVAPAIRKARFLRRRGIGIVHLNNSVLFNHDWMLAAQLSGALCLTHERGINNVFPGWARYFGKRLAAVICISDAVKTNMQQRGADLGNLITIHNGLDPDVMKMETPPEELRRRYGLGPDAVVVVMLGNLKRWKGQETLVRAIDQVRTVVPAVRCILVGDVAPGDQEYAASVRTMVADRKLEDHIIFAGYQRQVTDFLMMSDVVVHASTLPEPFGRVILEAMACRKPVVASRAGAIPEIVEEGVTGVTFPPGDDDSLAQAILTVIGDRERARRMGNSGYERLVREFHIHKNLEATQRLYETMLSAAD